MVRSPPFHRNHRRCRGRNDPRTVLALVAIFVSAGKIFVAVSDAQDNVAAAGICPPGFWGEDCEDVCSVTCQNGGQCEMADDVHGNLEEATDVVCKCPEGFSGPLCDAETEGCPPGLWGEGCEDVCPVRCQNGGQCVLEDDVHGNLEEATPIVCKCRAGFSGPLCSTGGTEQTASSDGSKASSSSSSSSLTSGAKIGITVGCILGFGLLGLLALLMVKRRGGKGGKAASSKSGGAPTGKVEPEANEASDIPLSATPAADLSRREESFVQPDAEIA